jgi:hypothetical protein
MKAGLLACSLLLLSNSSIAQQASTETNGNTGSVCVLPNSPEPPTRISPGGQYNPATLKLSIDDRPSSPWPHKSPLLLDDLDLTKRHLVVLTSEGKRIESFRFKFSDYNDERLCVAYDGYQGVQLGNRTNALWCKVATRRCWH